MGGADACLLLLSGKSPLVANLASCSPPLSVQQSDDILLTIVVRASHLDEGQRALYPQLLQRGGRNLKQTPHLSGLEHLLRRLSLLFSNQLR